jgi:uncharacterized protein (DUF427 family)
MKREPHLRGRGPHLPPLDQVVQYDFAPGYVLFTMPVFKRLRVEAAGIIVADTIRGVILQESDQIPAYYFPVDDVRRDLFRETATRTADPFKGEAVQYTLEAPSGVQVEDFMWRFDSRVPGCPDLSGLVSFDWKKADRWLEEDEEIFVHPRDPYRRVDILPSSRRVEVFVNGERVADSRRALFLFETGLPTRYYIPPEDVAPGILSPSDTHSRCPYKGIASYYDVTAGGRGYKDLVWFYPEPVHESARIAGHLAFAHEFVDRILVDGVEQERPVTTFSRGSNRGPAHPLANR